MLIRITIVAETRHKFNELAHETKRVLVGNGIIEHRPPATVFVDLPTPEGLIETEPEGGFKTFAREPDVTSIDDTVSKPANKRKRGGK